MNKLVGIIFLMVGLVVASVGGYFFLSTQDLLKNGLRSPGKVIELRHSGRYYTPVVQFETSDHNIITASCKIGSNPPTHQVDDSVTVIYRALSPQEISLEEPFELWFMTCIFGGLGLIFSIIGASLFISSLVTIKSNKTWMSNKI